jgi:hypothetical protein
MKPIIPTTSELQRLIQDKQVVIRRPINKDISDWFDIETDGSAICWTEQSTGDHYPPEYPLPYAVGDELYVREVWTNINKPGIPPEYYYKADWIQPNGHPYHDVEDYSSSEWDWNSPVTMPKEAARLFPTVKVMKVERVKNTSVTQLIEEGYKGKPCYCINYDSYGCHDCMGTGWLEPPYVDFIYYWNTRHPDYPYDTNPWTWAATIELEEKGNE